MESKRDDSDTYVVARVLSGELHFDISGDILRVTVQHTTDRRQGQSQKVGIPHFISETPGGPLGSSVLRSQRRRPGAARQIQARQKIAPVLGV